MRILVVFVMRLSISEKVYRYRKSPGVGRISRKVQRRGFIAAEMKIKCTGSADIPEWPSSTTLVRLNRD